MVIILESLPWFYVRSTTWIIRKDYLRQEVGGRRVRGYLNKKGQCDGVLLIGLEMLEI